MSLRFVSYHRNYCVMGYTAVVVFRLEARGTSKHLDGIKILMMLFVLSSIASCVLSRRGF